MKNSLTYCMYNTARGLDYKTANFAYCNCKPTSIAEVIPTENTKHEYAWLKHKVSEGNSTKDGSLQDVCMLQCTSYNTPAHCGNWKLQYSTHLYPYANVDTGGTQAKCYFKDPLQCLGAKLNPLRLFITDHMTEIHKHLSPSPQCQRMNTRMKWGLPFTARGKLLVVRMQL